MALREDSVNRNEIRSIIASTIGGVMTEEVGAVTGELEVAMRSHVEGIGVAVRYAEAEEWYTVEGSPIKPKNAVGLSPPELHKLHERIVSHLTTPGMMVEGNEEATSLRGFSPIAGDE